MTIYMRSIKRGTLFENRRSQHAWMLYVKMFVENKKNQMKGPVGESDKPPGGSTVVSCS